MTPTHPTPPLRQRLLRGLRNLLTNRPLSRRQLRWAMIRDYARDSSDKPPPLRRTGC
jgi:hypothetical protein